MLQGGGPECAAVEMLRRVMQVTESVTTELLQGDPGASSASVVRRAAPERTAPHVRVEIGGAMILTATSIDPPLPGVSLVPLLPSDL